MEKIFYLLIVFPLISCTNEKTNKSYIDIAKNHYEEGEYQQAIESAQRALEEGEDTLNAYLIMGNSEYSKGWLGKSTTELTNSLKYFTWAIEFDSTQSDLFSLRSMVKHDLNDRFGAINDINNAIKLSTDSTNTSYLYQGKHRILLESERKQDAIESLNKSIEFNSNNFLAYSDRGDIYYSLNNLEKALDDYSRNINMQPFPSASVFLSRGHIYLEVDSLEKACLDFTRAVELGYLGYEPLQLIDDNCQ